MLMMKNMVRLLVFPNNSSSLPKIGRDIRRIRSRLLLRISFYKVNMKLQAMGVERRITNDLNALI